MQSPFEEALQELVRRTRTHTGIDCTCDVESDGTQITISLPPSDATAT